MTGAEVDQEVVEDEVGEEAGEIEVQHRSVGYERRRTSVEDIRFERLAKSLWSCLML